MWFKTQSVCLLFFLLILIFVLLLLIILLLIILVLIFINLFNNIPTIIFIIIIIHSFPSCSLRLDSLFNFISHHHIILLFNTLQPRIFILILPFHHKISLLVNLTHILLLSHVKWLDHVTKILYLRLNIFFLVLVSIYV